MLRCKWSGKCGEVFGWVDDSGDEVIVRTDTGATFALEDFRTSASFAIMEDVKIDR